MANGKKLSDFAKILTVLITVATLTAGTVIWATTQFADQKDWTVEQDRVIKTDIEGTTREQYVPKHEFTPVQTQLDSIKDMLIKLDTKIDKALRQRRTTPRED